MWRRCCGPKPAPSRPTPACAQRLADNDPLAEYAQRQLMHLHYLRGDRAAAINVFERFEQRLKDELGTRPSAETIELLATIERGAATARSGCCRTARGCASTTRRMAGSRSVRRR